ncbi:MAG: peptidoglycan-binding protein [Treponema sp.]|jgi:hypothetical protein|nr:peptidoglycan-binding protein [Treponema sp.]
MKCGKVIDEIYEYDGGEHMPLLLRIRIALHVSFCPGCAREFERLRVMQDILRNDFSPACPDFEESIMVMIDRDGEMDGVEEPELSVSPGGLSTRGWVIAGLIVLFSLSTAFIGLDFNYIALKAGISFLLPVGITIGIVLTSYGALFIGGHLKELSELFRL